MPLTDREIEAAIAYGKEQVTLLKAMDESGNQHVNQVMKSLEVMASEHLKLLKELQSLRQQLSALRDELLADSEKSVASSGEGPSPSTTESFHRGRSAALYWVLGKLAEILKGTP